MLLTLLLRGKLRMHSVLSGLLVIMLECTGRLCKNKISSDSFGNRHHDHAFLCDPDKMTNGFCFINNVAVAAAYLKNLYRDKIKLVISFALMYFA